MESTGAKGKAEGSARAWGLPIPMNLAVVLGVLLGLFVLLNYSGMRLLMDRWDSDSNYGHGYLIPFISLYFVWVRKEELKAERPEANLWGLAVFVFGVVLGLFVMPMGSAVFSGLVIVVTLNGLLLYLAGTKLYKLLWLPALYLIFMVPLPQQIHSRLANPLQHFASMVSAGILDGILGITTIREGNLIRLAGHTLQVAEACSGMRSIMGLSALGVAFAYFWERPLWERVFLIVSTIPIAIVANICRVTGTGLTYDLGYEKFAQGFYHEFTGWFVFIFAMGLFLLEAYVLSHLFVYDRAGSKAVGAGAAGRGDQR
ncbi:MAG TPA: exosortase/archaeosortase family protein [Planctomycetota bacterium]|nr:exosortase/archaeosortase family protein [Planctomycetota bacterium]